MSIGPALILTMTDRETHLVLMSWDPQRGFVSVNSVAPSSVKDKRHVLRPFLK